MKSARVFYPVSALLLLALSIANLMQGKIELDLLPALSAIWNGIDSIEALVLMEIRLPRLLLAIVIGATLGLAGAALQGMLRNPLAGPGLVGVSNFAALGAVIALYFGFAGMAWYVLPLGGMVGAALSVILVFFLAGKNSGVLSLILAGVAVNAVSSSLISLVLNFADNPYAMSEIVFWLLGSVANRSYREFWIALPFMLTGWVLILSCRNFLDALSLGDDTAASMGFSLSFYRWMLITGVALSVGAAISVSGNIGFIGLVVPHLLRPLVDHQPGRLLPASAVGGACMLVAADWMVQYLSPNQELKLGVVTALVGGPFFLYLIYRMRSQWL